tara:strand:- start:1153 stop:1716 length:564 start_codon:yes stop_codon:yes gene_type:complete
MIITFDDLKKESHNHQKGKVCTKCNKHLPLSEFDENKRTKDGLQYQCKSCKKEYQDNSCPFKKWFTSKKARTKFAGVEFNIKPTDIPSVNIREIITETRGRKYRSWEAIEYPKVCFKWGMELDWGMNGIQYNSPSLDRIDPTKGYIPGNVRIVSQSYNGAKLNCPPDEWDVIEKTIAESIFRRNKCT